MEAARVAAIRGHTVILFERQKQLGGQLLLASASPHKTEVGYLTTYLTTQMNKLGVDVRPEHEVTPQIINEIEPDVVIIATGASFFSPQIPGVDGSNVYSAWDVISGAADVKGKKVIVAGGGTTACDVAEYLAAKGKEVTTVMRYPDIGMTRQGMMLEGTMLTVMLERFAEYRIKILPERDIIGIDSKGVTILNKKGLREHLEADSIVIALGSKSNDALSTALRDASFEVYTIGDAVKPRNILHAIREGSFIGRQI